MQDKIKIKHTYRGGPSVILKWANHLLTKFVAKIVNLPKIVGPPSPALCSPLNSEVGVFPNHPPHLPKYIKNPFPLAQELHIMVRSFTTE